MLKKIIVLAVIFAALTFSVPALADEPSYTPTESPTPTPEINDYYKLPLVRGDAYNINVMLRYYHEVLTSEQQKIARFLLGSYNFMYLTSRGFSYEDVNIFDDYVTKFDELAELIFQADSASNASRWSTTFQIYVASIITYAGNITDTFNDWIANDARTLLIPYTTDALNAWTSFYNDPSNEGVANYGAEAREWTLGINYPYAYESYSFDSVQSQSNYYNFLLNYSPVMYSAPSDYDQYAVSFKDVPLVDTIYVLRGVSGFQYYRFGFYNGTFDNYTIPYISLGYYDNKVSVTSVDFSLSDAYYKFTYNFNTIDAGSIGNIQSIINHAIYTTPIKMTSNNLQRFYHSWYIGITHIVLVDDLNTLANRQDVLNDFSLGLISDYDWIKTPKDNDLPYWWKPIDFDIEIEDPQGNLDPANDIDFDQNIVNNTVINNYDIVAPGVTINVPVDWFDSDGNYLDYTYNYGLPFFVFVGDVFNSLGEIRVIILGVLIFGLVSGIIVKFLQ